VHRRVSLSIPPRWLSDPGRASDGPGQTARNLGHLRILPAALSKRTVLGQIYTFLDGQWGEGHTVLDPQGREIDRWDFIASSDTGMDLVAGGLSGIYTSIDGGQNWNPSPDMADKVVNSVAMASATGGMKLVAAINNEKGRILVSDDGGDTWEERGPEGDWRFVASSADGKTLAAMNYVDNVIYISRNRGEKWEAHDNADYPDVVAISGDGTRIVSVLYPEEGDAYIITAPPTRTTVTDGWLSGGQYDSVDLLYVGEGVFVVPTFTSNPGGAAFTVH